MVPASSTFAVHNLIIEGDPPRLQTHPARMPVSASTSKLFCGEPTSAMLSLFILDDITRPSEGIGTRSLWDNIFDQFDAAIILAVDVV